MGRVREEKRREEREEKRREEKSRGEERRGREEEEKRREEKRRDETRGEERRREEKRRREKIREEKESEERVTRKSHKKEDPGARKGRKVAKHCVFQWFVAPEGRKVGSLKRRVRSQMRDEKLHAVVARSTFRSQNAQNTPCSDHFWKLRCRKSARRCGAKHISRSKCTKHTRFGPLLEVEMSKKCTPLWREAHFEVKMYKTHQVRTTFGS